MKNLTLVAIMILGLTSCTTVGLQSTDLSSLEVGMQKSDAEKILGSPRAVSPDKDGECREYRILDRGSTPPYRVYYKDAKVVAFGRSVCITIVT